MRPRGKKLDAEDGRRCFSHGGRIESDSRRRFILCLIHSILDLEADHVVAVLMVLLTECAVYIYGVFVLGDRYVHAFVDFTVPIIPSDSPQRFFLCLIHAITGIEADRVGTKLACPCIDTC